MAITIERDGYGYVEPNFLSAPRTGQVRADLPLSQAAMNTLLETEDKALMNGMFVKRHGSFHGANVESALVDNVVDFTGDGVWWLVFNEEKLYDERYQMHKHFAMTVAKKSDSDDAYADQFYDGKMVPRVLLPVLGDTFTTNCFAEDVEEVELGDTFAPNDKGMLAKDGDGFLMATHLYTMPDGQPGVKLEVIKNQ